MQNTSFKRLITISYMAKHFTDGLEKAHQYFFTMKWWWWGWGGGGWRNLAISMQINTCTAEKKKSQEGRGWWTWGKRSSKLFFTIIILIINAKKFSHKLSLTKLNRIIHYLKLRNIFSCPRKLPTLPTRGVNWIAVFIMIMWKFPSS